MKYALAFLFLLLTASAHAQPVDCDVYHPTQENNQTCATVDAIRDGQWQETTCHHLGAWGQATRLTVNISADTSRRYRGWVFQSRPYCQLVRILYRAMCYKASSNKWKYPSNVDYMWMVPNEGYYREIICDTGYQLLGGLIEVQFRQRANWTPR